MPVSDALKRIYATAPTDDYYVETLELQHPRFAGGAVYLTNQRDGWTGSGISFTYLPFAAIPPRAEDEAALQLQVALDNASRELMDALEELATEPTSPIVVIYRVYLASDPDTVQNDPPLTLDVLGVTANNQTISFSAGQANLRDKPFPALLYTTDRYPGLKR